MCKWCSLMYLCVKTAIYYLVWNHVHMCRTWSLHLCPGQPRPLLFQVMIFQAKYAAHAREHLWNRDSHARFYAFCTMRKLKIGHDNTRCLVLQTIAKENGTGFWQFPAWSGFCSYFSGGGSCRMSVSKWLWDDKEYVDGVNCGLELDLKGDTSHKHENCHCAYVAPRRTGRLVILIMTLTHWPTLHVTQNKQSPTPLDICQISDIVLFLHWKMLVTPGYCKMQDI